MRDVGEDELRNVGMLECCSPSLVMKYVGSLAKLEDPREFWRGPIFVRVVVWYSEVKARTTQQEESAKEVQLAGVDIL